ncbi:MAG: hypothetical protein ACOYOB_03915 [Myxococcota bacterium]
MIVVQRFALLGLILGALIACRAPLPPRASADAGAAPAMPALPAEATPTTAAVASPPPGLLGAEAASLVGAPRNLDRVLALGPGSGLLGDKLREVDFAHASAVSWTVPGQRPGTTRTYVALSDRPLCGPVDRALGLSRLVDGAQLLVFGLAEAATATDLQVPVQATVAYGKAQSGVLQYEGRATGGQVRVVSPVGSKSSLYAVFAVMLRGRGGISMEVQGRLQPTPCPTGLAPAFGPPSAAAKP